MDSSNILTYTFFVIVLILGILNLLVSPLFLRGLIKGTKDFESYRADRLILYIGIILSVSILSGLLAKIVTVNNNEIIQFIFFNTLFIAIGLVRPVLYFRK